MRQRGFTPILVVVFIALIAVGFYYLGSKGGTPLIPQTQKPSPTVDPTVNWKAYPLNSTLGTLYSFRYPQNVDVSEAQDLVYLKSGNSTLFFRFIGKTQNINNLMNNYQPFASQKIVFGTKTSVTYGSLSGYKATSINSQSVGSSTYYFLGKNSLNGILVFNYRTGDTVAENLFNQIVFTFKFPQ